MAGEMVEFPSNGGTAQGYVAKPDAGQGPGLVVIQEWWGLNDNIKGIADRFAAEGYVALAPDLYDGKKTAEPDEAMKLAMAMQMDEAAKKLSGAVDFLKAEASVEPKKVGCVGYCMGGGLSLYLSTIKPVDACVIYYGVLMGAQPDLNKIKGAVLGHYADHDDYASPEQVRALEKQLKDAGKDVEFQIYEGTQHGFFNDERPEQHAPDASRQSWERTLEFFEKHLK